MKTKTKIATDNPEYVTPGEFAAMFKMPRSTLADALDAGTIKSIRLPSADPASRKKLRRIPWSEVERIKAGKAS